MKNESLIMKLRSVILAENVNTRDGIEYVTVTGMEQGEKPLLQMFDYTLNKADLEHKGKLVGKSVEIQVETIRAIFSGRPQFNGHLTVLK